MESDLYQLHFTPLAYEDMDEILSYISNKLSNPQAAESLFEEIEKSIQRLKKFPYIGSEVTDSYLAAKGYRKLIVQNYLVFHLVDIKQKQIIIMRILFGAREYRNSL